VVVLYAENHSFDNILGALCVQLARCDGTTTAKVGNGHGGTISFTMAQGPDLVPSVGHAPADQTTAIAGGAMTGWNQIPGCSEADHYACATQYQPSTIPNVAQLASAYTISDHTFEPVASASWGSHLELAASTLDGFVGDNPSTSTGGAGWGCNTRLTTQWQASPGAPVQTVPSCVPKSDGSGAFEPTPVPWVPTIMDRLDTARLSWKIYASPKGGSGYGWAICPTFAECLDTPQSAHQVPNTQFAADATTGRLPAFSMVTPTAPNSEHNTRSMTEGDNWLGAQIKAVMSGSEWSSTAIFLTWDDCGCFYDHVPPPAGEGVRVPMIIISPYAKAAFVDPTPATLNSILAFTEHVFGLTPLTTADADAYDYSNSFTVPLTPVRGDATAPHHDAVDLIQRVLTPAEIRALRAVPPSVAAADDEDGT
jgi:phospholipase C